MREIKVETGVGPTGVPWKATFGMSAEPRGLLELRALLERGGCCAWMGRTGCEEPAVMLVMGGPALIFSLYREVHQPDGLVHAILCMRHFPDVRRDMDATIRRSQDRELTKAVMAYGIERDRTLIAVEITEAERAWAT